MPHSRKDTYVVTCENLRFSYIPGVDILKGVNLKLPQGALGIIFGRSGIGKTTLLKCLMGYLTATNGVIEWSNEDMTSEPTHFQSTDQISEKAQELIDLWRNIDKSGALHGLHRRMLYKRQKQSIMVFADCSNALHQLTAEENLRLVLAPVCSDPYTRENSIRLLLNITNLTEVRHHTRSQLSSGQLRRLCLAQSLAVNPRLLVWDEPTAGLDCGTKYELIHFLQTIRSMVHLPGIVITHDIDTALLLADEIYLFDDGRITKHLEVRIPTPRVPQELNSPAYRDLYLELIRFLEADSQSDSTRNAVMGLL